MNGFSDIAIIICVAAIFGVVARKLRQPEILGYIVAGIIIGIFLPQLKNHPESLELFSQIGVAFLLFIVGLELDLNEIKQIGKKGFLASIMQIILSWLLAFGFALLFGFSAI